MTTSDSRATRLAQANARSISDEHTPLVRNCWYVAAMSGELDGGALLSRRIADIGVVLYRCADGRVAALRDRCAHRSFPLSAGRLEGDTVVCGYHGFRYGSDGHCTEVPSQPGRCPAGIAVRRYPVVERAPFVWIWTGDAALADAQAIPAPAWMETSDEWAGSVGYLHLNASYVHLHENLLDLTHLSYLHAATFGTPDYASAPFDVDIGDGRFVITRTVAPTRLPPVYADSTGIGEHDAARIVASTFVSPGLSLTELTVRDLTLPEAQRRDYHLRTAQIVTPETQTSMHYHFAIMRDFALEDAALSQFILDSIKAAFHEDVEGLERIARLKAVEPDASFYEQSTAADRAGVAMRRYLKRCADAETEAATQAADPVATRLAQSTASTVNVA